MSDQVAKLRVADAEYSAVTAEGCTTVTLNMILRRLEQVKKGSRVAWLRGPPSSGKTHVAKSVALSLDREKRLAVSFFFDKSGQRKGASSLENFVTTLAAQFAERNPWYRSALAKITSDTPSILDQPPASQLGPLLLDPLQGIHDSRPELIPDSFIIIDGLEEYGNSEDLDKLMELVTRLEGLPRPFRIFLSFRPPLPNKDTPSTSFPPAVDENDVTDVTLQHAHAGPASPTPIGAFSKARSKILELRDATLGEAIGEPLRGHTSWVTSVSFSPDGKRLVSGSWDSTVRIWDAESGEAIGKPLRGHTSWVMSVSFSTDGKRLFSGSWDNTVRIWDAGSGEAIGEPLRGHTNWVLSVSFSPDRKSIASGSVDKTIRIWDAKTSKAIGEPLRGHTDWVRSVSFSPDGKHVASGSDDKTIRIWDAESGEAIGKPLQGHTNTVRSVSFSPDGKHIVSGSCDNTVRIWDAESGEAIGEPLLGHTSHVLSVSFSPDGEHIVSGSSDDTVRIWDAESGEAIGEPLQGHTGSVESVSFSPDGKHIVSGSQDNTVRIWDPLLILSFLDSFS